MTPTAFVFSKEKYIHIMEAEGISAALTQLHHDTIRWEHEAFEGREGYQPQMWGVLHQVRDFSRELWEISLMTQEKPEAVKAAALAASSSPPSGSNRE